MTRREQTLPMDWNRPSERFLAYLDRLSQSCVAHDRAELDKLLRMRMSSHLPRAIRDELEFFRRAQSENLRAPLKLMRYCHQMRQLSLAGQVTTAQLPLELREREISAPLPAETRGQVSRRGRRSKA